MSRQNKLEVCRLLTEKNAAHVRLETAEHKAQGDRCCVSDGRAGVSMEHTCITTGKGSSVPMEHTCITTGEGSSVPMEQTCTTTGEGSSVPMEHTCITTGEGSSVPMEHTCFTTGDWDHAADWRTGAEFDCAAHDLATGLMWRGCVKVCCLGQDAKSDCKKSRQDAGLS